LKTKPPKPYEDEAFFLAKNLFFFLAEATALANLFYEIDFQFYTDSLCTVFIVGGSLFYLCIV